MEDNLQKNTKKMVENNSLNLMYSYSYSDTE